MSCFSPRHLIVMIVWVMVEGLSSLAVLLLLGQPLMCSHNNCQEKTQLLMTFAILQVCVLSIISSKVTVCSL